MGLVYASVDQYAEAVRELKEAARLEPDSGHVHYQLSLLYGRMGEDEDGALEGQKAAALGFDPRDRSASRLKP